MEKQITQQYEDTFPILDGKDGYGWTTEEQRFIEVERGLKGKALRWFQLWKALNPFANLETFEIAFYHRYQLDMRPSLLEICWNEVAEWKIEWEEIKARLRQQQQQPPQIDQEATKSQLSTEQDSQ
ncbi:hypothetical protein AAHE18_06G233800 [Arachis hypogaea]